MYLVKIEREDPLLSKFWIFLTVSLLSSCAFYLRKEYPPIPELFHEVIIDGKYRHFVEKLSNSLKQRGVQIDSTKKKVPHIIINFVRFSRNINTIDTAGRVTSYVYQMDVGFSVKDHNGQILLHTALSQSHTQKYDLNAILNMKKEEIFLKNQIEDDLISNMCERLIKLSL